MARPVMEYDIEDEKRKNRKKRRPKGHFLNRGCQTDYRESETQTDPYTPTYSLPYPDAYPTVMALIKLTWGKGLPATLEDIVVIERALTRRILKVGSRDVEDDADFDKRVNLMEELEAQQWADREKELSQIMAQKMDLVSKMLIDLRSKSVNDHTIKMERVFEVSKKENMKYLADLKHRYMRDERKLDVKYTSPPKQFKRDVVKEYLDYDSQVYAPLVRNGPNLDMLHVAPNSAFPQYRNVDELERITTNKSFVKELEFNVDAFVKKARKIKLPGKDQRMEKKLEDVYNAFRSESTRKESYDDTALLKQMMNTIRRTDTPTIDGVEPEVDQQDQAIMTLQGILRGRAVQSMMRSEIRANMETMLEMKALHKADPYGNKATFGEVTAMKNLQIQREHQQDKQNEVTEITDQLEGETLGRMLDFLDKEMVRLLDERKIHALMLLAERERRMREAIEAGNRAKEEDIRRTNDEIFRQIIGIHQGTVDLYLEDIYLETMNRTADNTARTHVQSLARVLNEAAYLADHNTGEDAEELAADLVHSFLVPEMNRMYQRNRFDSLKARYGHAANTVTDSVFSSQGVVKEILNSLGVTIGEHMERGDVAVDGTQEMVEYLFKAAAGAVTKEVPITPPLDDEEEGEEGEMTIIPRKKSSRKSSGAKGDKEDQMEAIPKDLTDDSSDSSALDIDSSDGETEKPWDPIPVPTELKALLGEKSLELAYEAEVGVQATALYQNAKFAVDEIFTEMAQCVIHPDSEEFTDEELDDDETE